MQNLSAYFFSDFRYRQQTLWFKRLLYLFLLCEGIYYLLYYDLFFGNDSIVFVTPKSIGLVKGLAYLLYNSGSVILSRYFILAVLALSLINLFTARLYFIIDFLLWILVINLNNRIYPALTAGDILLNQFLFFNCFLSGAFTLRSSWQNELKIFLHNLSVIAIIVQISLVYLLSALAKSDDEDWLRGTALIAVSQIRHFSLFSFLSYSEKLEPLYIFMNYLVLFYQLFFPVLVWIRKIKKPMLLLGILMHLFIAFVMGLVGFGFIMILAYVFFWPPKQRIS